MKTQEETDDAYRALGRWFVEFSRVIFHMRHAIERRLAGEQDIMIPILALGEVPARQIADAFLGSVHTWRISTTPRPRSPRT